MVPLQMKGGRMQVYEKTIVVTGAGSGIGREMVLLLLLRGARVAAIDKNQEGLDETARLAAVRPGLLTTHSIDITNRDEVMRLPDSVIREHGQVDGLINNAGIIQPFVPVNDLSYHDIDRVMAVNFFGMVNMTKAFLPHLLKRASAHIVTISSMGGFLPVPGQSVYGASKAAVKLFTEGLHTELSETNVMVTIVFPGAMETNIAQNSGIQITATKKGQSSFSALPAPIAAAKILDAMEANAYRVVVGQDAKFMDILSRIHPHYAASFIYSKMKSLLKPEINQ